MNIVLTTQMSLCENKPRTSHVQCLETTDKPPVPIALRLI